jgi:ribonuclease III
MARAEIDNLEAAIGYRFKDPDILLRALTHRSHCHENGSGGDGGHNERFEFLGDAVLGLIVSQHLVQQFPAFSEGELSKAKAHLVSAANLLETAQRLNVGDYLLLGRCEEMSGGRGKRALLANAMEALIAAVYLDGGLENARALVQTHVLQDDGTGGANGIPLQDFKGALQELAQSLKLPAPRYAVVSEEGPEHAKNFVVEVRVGEEVAQGEGTSKKRASQRAAELVYRRLDQKRTAVPTA